ncbi:hypothetical protein D9757_010860 [Collybiopsis confluens]|uniref:F-box domain-containing protein n=1 Tax=Collybiopsis confluens TaxID=2823264 RepID=A0A8H5H853_9AGAR|nr:hypothetical protein D9757_010860 [Collybiopsis confluens]
MTNRRAQLFRLEPPSTLAMPTADTSTNSHAHSSAVHDKTANAGSEFEDDEEEEDKRPRKRVKRTKSPAKRSARKGKSKIPEQFRKVRGKTGLLEKLAKDVPLDVILEIFCYLDPGDLLRLARTTRDLRGTLMSKSSETVWRTAREGVEGIPPLPKDLNEPQYAHLLYESYYLWTQALRYRILVFPHKVLQEIFVARDSSSDFYWSLPSRLETVPHVIPVIFKRGPKGQWDGYLAHHPPTTKRYVAEFEDLATSEEQEKWIVYQDHERRMQTHNNLCQAWLKTKLGERGKELQDIRNQRKAAYASLLKVVYTSFTNGDDTYSILERLGDIGWREEAELIIGRRGHEDEFSDHKLVRQSKKLTNHGWNSIKDELVRWLEEQKTRRIGRERQETVSSRYQLLTEQIKSVKATRDLREPFPGVSEVLNHKILEDIVWETPIDEDITPDAMKAKLDEHLPEIVEQWRSAKVQEKMAAFL